VTDLGIKKIHHPAFAAWCKGKIVDAKVELRYDPFDLSEVQVVKDKTFYCKLRDSSLVRKAVPGIPEENKKPTISKETIDYFKNIREKSAELKRKEADSIRYSDLFIQNKL